MSDASSGAQHKPGNGHAEPKSSARPRLVATTAGGLGLGVLVGQAISGNPELIKQIISTWGAAFFLLGGVIFGLGWLMDRHLPAVTGALVQQAAAMGQMSESIREHFSERDQVGQVMRSVSGDIVRLSNEIKTLREAVMGEKTL